LLREALWYVKPGNGKVECRLCPRACVIPEGKAGFCRARRNESGVLYAESYGQVSSLALDPIEKKPLRRFYPGSLILSAGSYGCNFNCPFCQNHSISMERPRTEYYVPEALAELAFRLRGKGNIGLAYTYNEPIVSFEYVLDCAREARLRGMKNVLVTNGFISREPLAELLPYVDAMNIDLKSADPVFYENISKMKAGPGNGPEAVTATIEAALAACHVEVTFLLIPGENGSTEEVEKIASLLPEDVPLHIIGFRPMHKMKDRPPATAGQIALAAETAGKRLKYVYS